MVAILLLTSVIAMVAVTYSKHVVVEKRATPLTGKALEAAEIIDSELELVLQAKRAGDELGDMSALGAILDGSIGRGKDDSITRNSLSLDLSDLDGDRARIKAGVLSNDGIGSVQLYETALVPLEGALQPGTLPEIDPDERLFLASSSGIVRITISASQTLSDADLSGLLVIQDGVTLTLDDVLLQGAVISEAALTGAPTDTFSDVLAPRLVLDGSVRLIPDSASSGLSIFMPDGTVATTGRGNAQVVIEGDVVAYAVDLQCAGATHGNIASIVEPVFVVEHSRVGHGRTPRPWSDLLVHRAFDTANLAVVPRRIEAADVPLITGFDATKPRELKPNVLSSDPAADVKLERNTVEKVDRSKKATTVKTLKEL